MSFITMSTVGTGGVGSARLGQALRTMSDQELAKWLHAYNNPSETVDERRAREKKTKPKS